MEFAFLIYFFLLNLIFYLNLYILSEGVRIRERQAIFFQSFKIEVDCFSDVLFHLFMILACSDTSSYI